MVQLALALAVVACSTTVAAASDHAFEGELINLHGDGRRTTGKVEIGGEITNRGANGTQLYAISLGRERAFVVLLWKPKAPPPNTWPQRGGDITETWLWTEPYRTDVMRGPNYIERMRRDFIDAAPEQRRQLGGVFRLTGKVEVRRFLSNIDFQLDLDLAAEGDPPRRIKGTLYAGGSKPAGAAAPPEPVPKKGPTPPPGVDLGDPLKAVRAYAEALRDGDEAKLRSVHHTAGKDWDEAIDLFVRWAKSSWRLERIAAGKFGAAGAERVMGALLLPSPPSRGRDILENLPDAEADVRGDRATVDVEPVGRIGLRRVDGRWGIFMPGADGVGAGGQPGKDHAPLLNLLTTVQDQVAKDIDAGRFATADAAVEAANRVALEEMKKRGLDPADEADDDAQ